MNQRQRMTWAALDREAATAPATPGYGVEDQDHPAHEQDDPGKDDYNIGGPSEFAEDVHPGPYGDSGAPAIPGYGVEDQDHPAHQGQVGRQANLMTLVKQKSAKALRLAKATLGKKAEWAAIEDQAFAFMGMDDEALDASLTRLGGGFLADAPAPVAEEVTLGGDFGTPEDNGVMARIEAMEQELNALKRAGRQANQNDPKGQTLGATGKSAEEEKAEEKAVSAKSAASKAKLARLFTACDLDNDGFVTEEDWMGPPAVFAALDTDRDGIIAKHEVMAGEVPEAFKKQWDKGDADKGEDKEDKEDKKDDKEAKKAAKQAEDEADKKSGDDEKIETKKGGKQAGDDGDDDDAKEGTKKKAGAEGEDDEDKKASKQAFGHLADFDDEEMEMLQAMQYAQAGEPDGDEGPMACGDAGVQLTAGDEPDGDEGGEGGEDSDKEASFFATGFDPMGLADGTNLTAADKAAFEEVFGKQAGDDDDDDDEKEGTKKAGDEGEDEDKQASTRLASLLKPQPRKASTGVRTVGTQARTASARNEVGELSNLWTSDPDVSGCFS